MSQNEGRLREIVHDTPWFMSVLETVRACAPPSAVVGAGVIRTLVWDHLHGFEHPTALRDVDVAFFDPTDLSREREQELEAELAKRLPGIRWDVTNQAGVHLWYERKFGHAAQPVASVEEAVGRWPETATSVAVRLLPNDQLVIVAPCGLDDLFDLVLRHNPAQASIEDFRRRTRSKRIQQVWPRVTVIDEPRS